MADKTKLRFTNYKNAHELNKYIAKRAGGVCMLSFSGGKEAIACWSMLRKHFHTVIPVYYYAVPGLSFIEETLQYYENHFGQKIIRVPNPNLVRQLLSGMYQTPKTWEIIKSFEFLPLTYDELFLMVKQDLKLPADTWTAIGVRAFDNLNRYGSVIKYGAHNEKRKTFYPVYDMDIQELVDFLKAEKVKLPKDYKIWGKSFDGLDYRFVKPIKDLYPKDYEIIKTLFPLIEAEMIRYESN